MYERSYYAPPVVVRPRVVVPAPVIVAPAPSYYYGCPLQTDVRYYGRHFSVGLSF